MTNRTALFCAVGIALVAATSCSQTGPGTGSGSAGGSSTAGGSTGSGGASDAGGTTTSNSDTQTAGGSESLGGATSGNGGTQNSTETQPNAGGQSNPGSSAAGGATGVGGSTVAAGGKSATSSAGGAAAGGTSAKGGATGNGGTTAATGSSAPMGGATGNGGTTGNGTAAATGGTKAATGGAPGAGGTTAAATGGTKAATGGSATISVADIVPDLAAGFYWEGTCKGNNDPGGHNCYLNTTSTDCAAKGGENYDVTKAVKGTSGQLYTINFEVRGVVGTRCYMNGTRASTAAPSKDNPNNWWYVGGVYTNSTGWWNAYELHVSPTTGDASGDVYYFNGLDASVEGGTWCEQEATYAIKYNASFKVKGGGSLMFRIHDQNCKAQQNCGANAKSDPESSCNYRTIDLSGMSPQPPSTFKQPPTNATSKTWYPQWMWIVATSVTSP